MSKSEKITKIESTTQDSSEVENDATTTPKEEHDSEKTRRVPEGIHGKGMGSLD